MQLNSDFVDLLRAFSSERVRYLVVGGLAVIEHTEPRYTKDLDVWVEPTLGNASRVYRALKKYGAPLKDINREDFAKKTLVYQMGVEPVRIDVLMALEGVSFDAAWRSRKIARWGGLRVNVLSRANLIANKRRVGRPQDLLDVQSLRRSAVFQKPRKAT